MMDICLWSYIALRPVFTHGHLGPGPRAANFQGQYIKKIEIEVWYVEKKGCPRERSLREICTENNVGTEFSRYHATGARRSWGNCLLAASVKLDFENVISVFTSTKARRSFS